MSMTNSCSEVLLCGLQWFLEHDATGKQRSAPLCGDMTVREGLLSAALFIEWIGHNQPGHSYKKKAAQVVNALSDCNYIQLCALLC